MKADKYLKYTAIDFLKDEDFLRWNLFSLEEDNIYWESLMNIAPELKPTIDRAIGLYKSEIMFNDYKLSEDKIDSTYKVIKKLQTRVNKRRTLYYWLSGVASILILALGIGLYFTMQNYSNDSGLLSYMATARFEETTSFEDIQIQMSTDTAITFDEKTVDISYDTDSIKAVGKPIVAMNESDYSRLIVPKGKRSILTLSDGTILHINSGSSVVYPNKFVDESREIYVNGEVFLDVASDKNKPFIVRTKDLSVSVLGTKFNIQAYEEDKQTSVVLASGVVKVKPSSSKKNVTLKPSQMYDYNGENYSVSTVDVYKHISWMDGIIFANDESLDVLLNKLSRYYGLKIEYDESISSQKCSGKVDLKDDLEEVLGGLTFSFPISVQSVDGVYKISSK